MSKEMQENMQVDRANEADIQRAYIEKCREYLLDKEKELGRPLTACVNTFGCQMNARDSEKLLGILEEIGYKPVETEDADIVIYNTCTVRENANLRVYGRLGQLHKFKEKNPDMLIILCGCMMQEPEVVEKIRKSYRFVDIVFGTFNIFKLAELIHTRLNTGSQIIDIWKGTDYVLEQLPTDRKYKFKSGVNIMYGCDNFCSYCIVPYVRGREMSRPPIDIIRESERLVADGVREIMYLGQNVNSYGKKLEETEEAKGSQDVTERVTFADLLKELEKIEGLDRIRFMTPHPKDFSDELIETIAASDKVCHHLHLPLQSGSSRILKAMNRHYTKEQYLALVDKIREKIPDVSITTDIIVGFPGETEEDFEDTLDVVRQAKYDSAYTFIYSKRTGTPAAKMENQIDEATVKKRFDRLLATVAEVSHSVSARFEGQVMDVLVEGLDDHEEGLVTGRLKSNMLVHFKGKEELIGQIVQVKLTECKGFYYLGEMIN